MFEQILQRVTIADIIESVGIPTRRNRANCPIHGGGNPTSFSFTDSTYHCFACEASGGLVDLAQILWSCDRKEAFDRLCSMAGLPAPDKLAISSTGGLPVRVRSITIPPHIVAAKEHLLNLESLRRTTENEWREIRKRLRRREVELAEFYFAEQLCLYQLDELDAEIAIAKHEYNKLRKVKP